MIKPYNHTHESIVESCGISTEVMKKFDDWFTQTLFTKNDIMSFSYIVEYFENKVTENPSLLRKLIIMNIIQSLKVKGNELMIDSLIELMNEGTK